MSTLITFPKFDTSLIPISTLITFPKFDTSLIPISKDETLEKLYLKDIPWHNPYTGGQGKFRNWKYHREKLANLEKFINHDDTLAPLIKMALMHYQFEAIHPFADGNGRTGRILLLLYLKMGRLLDIPVIYLSEYIIKNKIEYYKKLRI
jgi:hypothetical protein